MIENKKKYLEAVAMESMKNLKDYMESLKKEREEKKRKEESEQNLANQRRESVALERQICTEPKKSTSWYWTISITWTTSYVLPCFRAFC